MESPADNHEVGDKEENNVSEAYFDEMMLLTMRRVQLMEASVNNRICDNEQG